MSEPTEVKVDNNQPSIKSRLVSMLVLAISFSVAESVLIALVVGQILFALFAKEQNDSLKKMAKQVINYMYETLSYLTFNSEERPFPYKGWDEHTKQPIITTE
jgi:hypothetical protein